MVEENYHIDEIFRKGLINQSTEPPEEIWTNVQSRVPVQKKTKTLTLFFRYAAGLAILISSSLTILYLLNLSPGTEVSEKSYEQPLMIQPETNVIIDEKSVTAEHGIIPKSEDPVIISEKKPGIEIAQTDPVLMNREITSPVDDLFSVSGNAQELIASISWQQLNTGQYQLAEMRIADIPEPDFQDKETLKRQWEIGFSSAPSFSHRTLSSSNGGNEVFNYLKHAENGKISFAGYLYIRTKLSNRLGVRTGIRFSNQGYTTGGIAQISSLDENPVIPVFSGNWNSFLLGLANSAGLITYRNEALLVNKLNPQADVALINVFPASVIGSQADYRLVQNLYYLGIPVEVILYPGREGKFYFLFGLETGILLGNSVHFDTGEYVTRIGSAVGLNKFYYSASVGIGKEFAIRQNLYFTIEPGFQYFFSPLNSHHIVSAKPYSFGVSFGINFQR